MNEVAYQRLPARLASQLLNLSNPARALYGPSQQALAPMLGASLETIGARLRLYRDADRLKSGDHRGKDERIRR